MSGKRLLFDTNAIVALLRGHATLNELAGAATWIGISIISQIEFLCFSKISSEDEHLFQQFAARVEVIGITPDEPGLITRIIEIRNHSRRKIPDAVIAATALHHNAELVTADSDFEKVTGLSIQSF